MVDKEILFGINASSDFNLLAFNGSAQLTDKQLLLEDFPIADNVFPMENSFLSHFPQQKPDGEPLLCAYSLQDFDTNAPFSIDDVLDFDCSPQALISSLPADDLSPFDAFSKKDFSPSSVAPTSLKDHTYSCESFMVAQGSPCSVDSGFTSEDDSNDILLQLLSGDNTMPQSSQSALSNVPAVKELPFDFTASSELVDLLNETLADMSERTSELKVQETSLASKEKTKRRHQPYKRKTSEQKQRKKAQNRQAASRYRDKKKFELDDIVNGAAEVEKQNAELKERVSNLQKEIGYLKDLMLDVIKARLSKSNNSNSISALENILQTPSATF